ncbi:MAG: YvcK family protein [Chloroflexota bacterium]|jgi:uncharacterized cofD-like protein
MKQTEDKQKRMLWRRWLWLGGRWLTLGLGLKRWLIVLGVGAALTGLGLVYVVLLLERWGWLPRQLYEYLMLMFLPVPWRIVLLLVLGLVLIAVAVWRMGLNLVAPFHQPDEQVVERLHEYHRRKRGPHVVVIGGGTGMPNLLRGLREYTGNITAVVTVADDGGSSGRLRRELGLLPPGDFRNNIAALSRDEALMTQVLQYRFGSRAGEEQLPENGSGRSPVPGDLQGHAFGNLLLAALTGIMGSFDEALLAAERVLAVRGRVLPSTLEQVTLVADVAVTGPDGTAVIQRISGESAIPKAHGHIQQLYLEPANVRAYPPVLQAILQADLIVMGPGSLYTSILPNLLVPDLVEALSRSRAPKLYVCNLAIQPGETDNYTVADHVDTILDHIPTNFLDIVLANNNLSIASDTGGGQTIFVEPVAPQSVRMITADLVDEARPWRHDSTKLAQAIMSIEHA